MDKQNVVQLYNGILATKRKNVVLNRTKLMDEKLGHYCQGRMNEEVGSD